MNKSHWGRVKQLFAAACELSAERRECFLKEACGADLVLRNEVESLLAAHQPSAEAGGEAGGLLEGPGTRIGPYKLLEKIGEGGFGTVFLAEQEEPLRRRVALKVIKAGMDTRQVVARFEQERQALALMDHPGIARVFDGGSTSSGRPYFVMELVRGDPITAYCDRERLSMTERLELFAEVCRAVQHAHQKGVIHRDLKPGNVLVTIIDGRPLPKVIDFGIAKATQGRLTEKTLFTEHRQMIGTPLYMSPEQAYLSGVDVDIRSDVYSLGVLLYELLTGVPPFEEFELLQAGIEEMHRIIRELEPRKPSTRVATLGPATKSVAAQRKVEPEKLGTSLRGDLDWIVMRCLEKERARRYDSASDLAQDVRRHLAGDPVEAAPPSAAYRMRKFVQRHRARVIAASTIVLVLLLGVVGTSLGLVRARMVNRALAAKTEEAEWGAYSVGLMLVQNDLAAHDYPSARDHAEACPEHLRGWEWWFLWRQSQRFISAFPDSGNVQFSPTRDFVLWGAELYDLEGRQVGERFWPSHSGPPRGSERGTRLRDQSAEFSHDGKYVLISSSRTLALWDLSGRPVGADMSMDQPILYVGFSPDDRSIWAASHAKVRLWDYAGGIVADLPNDGRRPAFSSDGERILTLENRTARLWDRRGLPVGQPLPLGYSYYCGFAPGQQIVWTHDDGTVYLWDFEGDLVGFLRHGDDIAEVVFSPDGSLALTRTGYRSIEDTVRLWDLRANAVGETMHHGDRVVGAIFRDDGQRILTFSTDGSARQWALDGTAIGDVMQHDCEVDSASFSPDGQRIVTSSGEWVWLWEANGHPLREGVPGLDPQFTDDSSHLLVSFSSIGYFRKAELWDRDGVTQSYAQEYVTHIEEHLAGSELALSASGYASAFKGLWDMSIIEVPERKLYGLAARLAGSLVQHGDKEPKLPLTPVESGTGWPGDESLRGGVFAGSPDGTRIVTGGENGLVEFWEPSSRRRLAGFRLEAGVSNLAFSPDGTQLVLELTDGTIRIWDTRDAGAQRDERQRLDAERGPAQEYLQQLLAGPLSEDDLSTEILRDPSLSPARRLVVGRMFESWKGISERRAEHLLETAARDAVDEVEFRAAVEALDVEPRLAERLRERATSWEPSSRVLAAFARRVAARPGASAADLARAVQAARQADDNRWLGAALYRSGAFQEARLALEEARHDNDGMDSVSLTDLALLAMACSADEDYGAARAALNEARAYFERGGGNTLERSLLSEAEAVVMDASPVPGDSDDR